MFELTLFLFSVSVSVSVFIAVAAAVAVVAVACFPRLPYSFAQIVLYFVFCNSNITVMLFSFVGLLILC